MGSTAQHGGGVGPSSDLDDSWFDWARHRRSERPVGRAISERPNPPSSIPPSIDPAMDEWFRD